MTTASKGSNSEASTSRKIGLSCAECRRSKLKCDRTFPCQSCIRRGCAGICPEGTLAATKGNKVLMAHAQKLSEQVKSLTSRIRELEGSISQSSRDTSEGTHALKREPPSDDDATRHEDVYEAIGSLSIGMDGQTKYHGESAGSEYLQSLLPLFQEDRQKSRTTLVDLPPELVALVNAFPFGLKDCSYTKELFVPYFPSKERAVELTSLYYRHVAWMYDPIAYEDFITNFLDPIYGANNYANLDTLHSHRLSVFFIILASGNLYDPHPSTSTLGRQYHALSRASFSLSPISCEVTCATIQALFLTIGFMYNSNLDGKEERWLLTGLCARASQTIGLQRESAAWNLENSEVQRRRRLFWELFTWESWSSLVNGRPGALLIQYTDCLFPEDLDPHSLKDSGELDLGFHAWKFRYSATCLSLSSQYVFSTKTPLYSALLEIDKTIRKFPIPPHLRAPISASEVGRSWSSDPSRALQQYCVLCFRESNLLYLHRSYFVQAIRQASDDPLRHKYAPSVLATYRSACQIISSLRELYPSCPIVGHVWLFWSGVFSSCIVLGALVIESPGCGFSREALHELELTLPFYEEGSRSCRPPSTMTMLQKLYERATSLYSAYKAGVGGSYSRGLRDRNQPDELEVLDGRKSVITAYNRSYPPELIPSSPNTHHDDRSTSGSQPSTTESSMEYYDKLEGSHVASGKGRDYVMTEDTSNFEDHRYSSATKHLIPHIPREGHAPSTHVSNHYVANQPPDLLASHQDASLPSHADVRTMSKNPHIWHPSYPSAHHSTSHHASNISASQLPYANVSSPFQTGSASFGFPPSQEQNQDEIWRSFIFEYGG